MIVIRCIGYFLNSGYYIFQRHVKSCLHVGGCTGLNISSLQSPVVMDFFTSQLAAPLVEFASSANPAEVRTHTNTHRQRIIKIQLEISS